MTVFKYNGKVLKVNGAVATNADCCCDPGDPGPSTCTSLGSVDLTLSGILACNTCASVPGQPTKSTKWTLVGIDGTYSVPFTGFSAGRCVYSRFIGFTEFSGLGMTVAQDNHDDATCTLLDCTGNEDWAEISLYVEIEPPLVIKEIRAEDLFIQGGPCGGLTAGSALFWNGTAARGDSVANQNVDCTNGQIASITGTASVDW